MHITRKNLKNSVLPDLRFKKRRIYDTFFFSDFIADWQINIIKNVLYGTANAT